MNLNLDMVSRSYAKTASLIIDTAAVLDQSLDEVKAKRSFFAW